MRLHFIGIGPQRAGTTWLHENLVQHPDVCLPKPPIKETFFFDQAFENGIDHYASFFAEGPRERARAVGEFGPSYFDVAGVPERIRSVNPDCKIVVSVRNPVERAYSLFIHMTSYGEVPLDFERAIKKAPQILTSGRYRAHLERWMGVFPREQTHFVVLDDIKRDPRRVFDALCGFLEVPADACALVADSAVNAARLPQLPRLRRLRSRVWHALARRQQYGALKFASKLWRLGPARFDRARPSEKWPQLTSEQRARLGTYFEEDVRFIESVLGRSLDAWRQQT
jgi:hypothetical protein